MSINNLAIKDVLNKIYPYISAERLYLKHAKLELFSLPRYYWRVFGEQHDFDVTLRLQSGQIKQFKFPAIRAIAEFESVREEIFKSEPSSRFYNNTAYLYLAHFGGDEAQFRMTIDNFFKQTKLRKVDNVILDFRNNAGGNDSHSDYLVSYIASKPFHWNSSFRLKTSEKLKQDTQATRDTSLPFWQQILAHENGTIYSYSFKPYTPQPAHMRFNGNVYVLINRQSHSQAAVTAAQLKDYALATLVGEETGDAASLYASQFSYALPKTGINVKVAKGEIIRVNGQKTTRGVLPDIVIRDHLLDEKDEILDVLLDRLGAQIK